MKIFTIHLQPGDEPFAFTAGVQTVPFTDSYDNKFTGIPLGNFKSANDAEVQQRYFRIISKEDTVTLVKPKIKNDKLSGLFASDEDSTEQCALYLDVSNTRENARFVGDRNISKESPTKMVVGRICNSVTTRSGKEVKDECHPTVYIVDKNQKVSVSFFDATVKTHRFISFVFDGETLNVVENTIKERKPFVKKEYTPRYPAGSFGDALGYGQPDGVFGRDDRRRNDRRRHERNRKEDRWN